MDLEQIARSVMDILEMISKASLYFPEQTSMVARQINEKYPKYYLLV